jgi:pyrroline-5-carboxylate reductase
MKPLVAITGHISPFFEMLKVTQDWAVQNGVASDSANAFVAAFYTSMANSIEPGSDFSEHSDHNATPGGINEQALARLRTSDHFDLLKFSLSEILHRLNGGGK